MYDNYKYENLIRLIIICGTIIVCCFILACSGSVETNDNGDVVFVPTNSPDVSGDGVVAPSIPESCTIDRSQRHLRVAFANGSHRIIEPRLMNQRDLFEWEQVKECFAHLHLPRDNFVKKPRIVAHGGTHLVVYVGDTLIEEFTTPGANALGRCVGDESGDLYDVIYMNLDPNRPGETFMLDHEFTHSLCADQNCYHGDGKWFDGFVARCQHGVRERFWLDAPIDGSCIKDESCPPERSDCWAYTCDEVFDPMSMEFYCPDPIWEHRRLVRGC